MKKAHGNKLEVAEITILYTMDVWSYAAGKIRNERIRGTTKVGGGGNHKECPGNEVEVVWTCDKKRGTLCRKEGDGN